jgi:flagellar hook assembly protein FlgD
VDAEMNTIVTAITHFGKYAIKEDLLVNTDKLSIADVNCQPRIFSPESGGFGTHTAISFNLGKNARMTVKVYNRAGKLKRILEEDREMTQGVNVVYWDGKDNDNNIVGSDLYIVTITAGDATVTKTVAVSNK